MPSSELAYKALYTAVDARSKALERPPHAALHADVFVETGAFTSTSSLMFMVRSTTIYLPDDTAHARFGLFARVDKRCATAPRIETIPTDDVADFLAALPPLVLGPVPVAPASRDGVGFEVRVRDPNLDVTLHFANPRGPRGDLVALGAAITELAARVTAA